MGFKGSFQSNICRKRLSKKRSNLIDAEGLQAREGDPRFRRWEYWGHNNKYSCFFALHYTGEHTIFEPFSHQGTKKKNNPFVRSAPFVKEKVACMMCKLYMYHVVCVSYR